ncbi:hypothetical protein BVRB_1g006270 [Beta vulgaris subsp. vulgaris]|uniref:uncharacterized protein LOC104888902 n=1 Tax=Beta vulgaris subsp. vulgaris TaxID=3555 RepID=UPI0005401C89|nr:uncharacterized protein LOC104888902 [Beta vulgaris subsp. vulgaris]XP_010672320.1 uncharacterized protein LOC104888902 [Beta vulgaris subsp. vulgaris]XP_010672327.1 uncharacterized protein LOC104888902 [Beta vulgaris subsp. vulgaris]XP_019103964.1 uncharacterized protein LOC104888902 [Beta vulgaris subsp. vulgaris]KMT20650.1 hypothetical protein BVRB_1g006270 [Beta vulgaris subsp. vulgaris]
MGALALPTPWIPEDDLLLKNAIEAGASLESLAKGAVQFSRRFTIKELQDRWLALLYDPIISTRAAEQMVELERAAPNLASKSNRADHSKGSKSAHGKRRAESVRKSYYAMRKRVCNDPLKHGDISFLVAPGDNCFMSGAEAPVPDNMLGDPMASHFGLEHGDFDLHHVFPQVMSNGAQPCGVSEFPIDQHNTLEDQNTMLVDNMDIKEHPGHNMFEATGIEENSVCHSKNIMCSGFEGTTIFNPNISDCENSFRHLQYTSPPPALPDWKTIEGISVPEMPDDVGIRGKNAQTGEPFVIPDGGNAGGTSDYDVMRRDPELINQMRCDDFKNSTGCAEVYFAELTDSLFNFSSDDEMLSIDGEKGVIDKTYFEGLSSLLLDSPNDINEDRLPNVLEAKQPADTDVYIDISSSTGLEEKKEKNDAGDPHLGDNNLQNCSDTQVRTPTACANSEFPEYCNGVIVCTLNTEDPEIPCNDDIIFPSRPRPASTNRRTHSEANNSSVHGKDTTGTQSTARGLGTLKREQKRLAESHPASQTRGPDVGLNRAADEFGVKFEKSRAETLNGPRSSYGGSCQSGLAVKKEPSELPLARQHGCSVAEKQGLIADIGHLHTSVGGMNQEAQTSSALRNQELGSMDGMGEPLLSDPEEQFSESDTDIPYFSDIESMILDMDLGPEDQDLFCSREVAKYQNEDVKRAIIRLEQNAHSYMQRSIASHGAFAILYGRHSKHYLKKPEVLLGRATDDVSVDVDLGREGRANKISRRQAIIKMDKDGAFNIKNTGKCSIYVNSKEIFPGQSLILLSNCLVEIRGMPFIFETNQARIKQYLDNAARKLEDKRLNN